MYDRDREAQSISIELEVRAFQADRPLIDAVKRSAEGAVRGLQEMQFEVERPERTAIIARDIWLLLGSYAN
jgi:hypothetical protein